MAIVAISTLHRPAAYFAERNKTEGSVRADGIVTWQISGREAALNSRRNIIW